MPSAAEYFLTVFENRNPQRATKAVSTSSEPFGSPAEAVSVRLTMAVAVKSVLATNEAERAVPEDVCSKRSVWLSVKTGYRLNESFLVSRTLRDPKQYRSHL